MFSLLMSKDQHKSVMTANNINFIPRENLYLDIGYDQFPKFAQWLYKYAVNIASFFLNEPFPDFIINLRITERIFPDSELYHIKWGLTMSFWETF